MSCILAVVWSWQLAHRARWQNHLYQDMRQSHTEIRCPYKATSKTDAIRPIYLLLKGYCVIVGHPLIVIKLKIVHSISCIMGRLDPTIDDILDLVMGQNSTCLCARPGVGSATKRTSRFVAAGIFKGERPPVKAKSHDNFARWNLNTPE